MIILSPNSTFEAPVMISLIGVEKEVETTFTFKVLSRPRLESFLILSRGLDRGRWRYWRERAKLCWRAKRWAQPWDMLDEIVHAWSGFDKDYSKESMKLLLEESPISFVDICNSFLKHQEEARIKN